ncbi:expressed unknown protein [Seminavis robusta]|uniref:Uncharacterized protein n=1 Tax=Seminavis robusta TaxID=568900 RepID=A0A9N8F535_9STRA|nr:expressed unknown protein [Seminavis robusta]|eukprot:Sro4005_g352450.1 n/a (226) ;mRNA; r:1343-2020
MARKKQIHSFDSSSDMSTSSSCYNSVATQTSHSSSQGNSDEGIPIAKKKKSGQCSCETKVDPQDDVSILSNRQTLLACIMFFVVGVYSGVAYVGWVQLSYGFGVDPELEERYLPYGPSTVRARDDVVAAPLITSPTATATTKKRIQLNRDNRKLQKPMVSTLFGIEYGNVVGSTAADSTAAVDDDDAGDETKTSSFQISSDWYRLASTSAVSLTPKQVSMIQALR